MAKAVKLADIAKRVGVSTVSVSKALSGKGGVSSQVQEQIEQVAKELGYVSKADAKKRKSGSTGNIGVLLPQRFVGQNTFYWGLYQEIVNALALRGFYGILELLSFEDEKNQVIPKMILDKKVDGVIVLGQARAEFTTFLYDLKAVPVIFLDYYVGKEEYDTVISDGFHGMYRLTNYLIDMGHREIGFVGTTLATSSITDRYLGYIKALMEAGIEPKTEWLIPDRELGTDTLVDLVLPKTLPTAFACNCDVIAYRLLRKLKERGLSVPEDISIVGYDNYAYEDDAQDPVTTYDVGMRRMAETCVRALVSKIYGDRYYKGVQIVTGHIVYKKSVRRIR
ncbi:MAG TPA: substrate-binding domain-containing protein [Lachnospiraceae bacterium]|nr:substrate-binding domain-containing protein [Lachnospiraceae bacterium]